MVSGQLKWCKIEFTRNMHYCNGYIGGLVSDVAYCGVRSWTRIGFSCWTMLLFLCVWNPTVQALQPYWSQWNESGDLSRALLYFSETNTFTDFLICLPVSFLSPFCLTWRWVATQSLRPSHWASSSPPNLPHLPLHLHSPSMVYPSQSHGTSSSVSLTSRTSALLFAVFTSVSLSSSSHNKVSTKPDFVCGSVWIWSCVCIQHHVNR